MSKSQTITEYSPNICWGKQHVEITLMQWAYKAVFNITVGGNTHGMSVLECAVGILYDSALPDGDGPATVILKNAKGDTLHCADDEDRGDAWLQDMVVCLRITAHTPPTLNEVRAMNGAPPVDGGDKPWSPL